MESTTREGVMYTQNTEWEDADPETWNGAAGVGANPPNSAEIPSTPGVALLPLSEGVSSLAQRAHDDLSWGLDVLGMPILLGPRPTLAGCPGSLPRVTGVAAGQGSGR